MAMKRKHTQNIVVVMSGTPLKSTEWDLSCVYRERGVSGIGSHYVILHNGDVVKGRPSDEHGNVHPRHNGDSVFIEVMGKSATEITPQQQTAIDGVVSRMEEMYLDAVLLELQY